MTDDEPRPRALVVDDDQDFLDRLSLLVEREGFDVVTARSLGDVGLRLAVFPLQVPALRERDGDVPLLAQHFLDALNAENGTEEIWAPSALERLEGMAFPGNVRELENLVSRAYVLGDEVLGSAELGTPSRRLAAARTADDEGGTITVSVGRSIADVEQELIEATLLQCDGDKSQAADVLGISLKTLYNRLKVYAAAARARGTRSDDLS